jgi:hypothetical protein
VPIADTPDTECGEVISDRYSNVVAKGGHNMSENKLRLDSCTSQDKNLKTGQKMVLYHGTDIANLKSILANGIVKPSMHGTKSNWANSEVQSGDSIYLSKLANIALIYGGVHSATTTSNFGPNGYIGIKKYKPGRAVVIFECEVEESSLGLEEDKIIRCDRLYQGLTRPGLLKRLTDFRCDSPSIRPLKYAIIPPSNLQYSSSGFKIALKFWDHDVVQTEFLLGVSYLECADRDTAFVKKAIWKKCA